jgi:ribonuclease HI
MHLLFKCPTAKELWQSLGLENIINEATSMDRAGSAVLEYLLRQNGNTLPGFEFVKLKETICVSAWYLWWIRRRRTHNEEVPPLLKCKMSILAITANAMKAEKKAPAGTGKWIRPPPRTLKLNVDASFVLEEKLGATGAVLRDFMGTFVHAKCELLPHVQTAAMAEAMALREGLKMVEEMGCHHVMVESDSAETIQALTGENRWWNESSAIFADCIDIASNIGEVQFIFCPRDANQVAHEIAKYSFQHKIACNWDDEPPSFLLDKLLNDVTMI